MRGRNKTAPLALTASGGMAVPLEPIYSLVDVSATNRILKDAFPNYAGGSMSIPKPMTIGWPWEANTPESFYLYERWGDPR